MSRDRNVSILAGRASRVVGLKKPSDLIPFKGNFPLLKPYQMSDYFDAVRSTNKLEDLSVEFQEATIKGNRIVVLEEGFRDYLLENGITLDSFQILSNSEKSNKLISWMSRDCIDVSQLTIK